MKKSSRDENFQQNQNVESKNQEKVTSFTELLQSVKNSQKTTCQVDNQIALIYTTKTKINFA